MLGFIRGGDALRIRKAAKPFRSERSERRNGVRLHGTCSSLTRLFLITLLLFWFAKKLWEEAGNAQILENFYFLCQA
jgi:hypothetical protein